MQTRSPPCVQALPTVFGPRSPELPASARADLAACRSALRHGSKTFLAASLLLPRSVHEPASALYAFCRLADDAVDGPEAGFDPAARLRERIALAYAGRPIAHPADRALAAVVARHAIPCELFEALLEGFDWDTEGRRYESLEDLHAYAARVAGTVGAMMALLMGARTPSALARACELGVAMQLSNIARDVGEDARMGRLYLPRAWMREAGLDPDAWLARPSFTPALAGVVRRVLEAAEALYARAGSGVACLPLSCRPGINAARLMYAAIGHEVARRGYDAVTRRARVRAPRKLALLLRAAACVLPSASARAMPALPAIRFLVDLAATPEASSPRGLAGRAVWVIELFARLEQRERTPASRSGAVG